MSLLRPSSLRELHTARATVKALTIEDEEEALAVCALDPVGNAFVAGRIAEGCLRVQPGALLGYAPHGQLEALLWANANFVPAQADPGAIEAFAHRVRRWGRQAASIFGPSAQSESLWSQLEEAWGPSRSVRAAQPLMSTTSRPSSLGIELDPRVRPATRDEVDIVLPASAAMFTDEIGYPPYAGSAVGYRALIAALIDRGHTWVWVHEGEVLFKADVGSVGLDTAQVQGVWLHPRLRGQGLAVPLMAAMTEQAMESVAPCISLYVNAYNAPARATYRAIGYEEVGTFTTVLL